MSWEKYGYGLENEIKFSNLFLHVSKEKRNDFKIRIAHETQRITDPPAVTEDWEQVEAVLIDFFISDPNKKSGLRTCVGTYIGIFIGLVDSRKLWLTS